ncbi:7069_t:CDS:2, partial [Gigaspora margarita]
VNTFTPPPRAEQAAILINNRIYFNGGWNNIFVSDFFYLDVSEPFTTASMNWTDLSSISGRIMRTFSTACISEINKGQIIYFSGKDIATSGNFTAVERKSAQCIASGNEIYIYSGYDDLFNMIKLDALNLKWSMYYPGLIASIGLLGYSATLLNNASILYMG